MHPEYPSFDLLIEFSPALLSRNGWIAKPAETEINIHVHQGGRLADSVICMGLHRWMLAVINFVREAIGMVGGQMNFRGRNEHMALTRGCIGY